MPHVNVWYLSHMGMGQNPFVFHQLCGNEHAFTSYSGVNGASGLPTAIYLPTFGYVWDKYG